MTCIHCCCHNHENFPFCGSCGKNLQITLNCDSCGEETPAEAMFCGSCGISFSQTFSCDSCGEENPSESLFCGSCGTTFETFEQKDSINNYRRQPHDFWTQIFQYPPKYFWVLLICMLIGGLSIWGLYSNQTSSSDDTSEAYIPPESPGSIQRDVKTPTAERQDIKNQKIRPGMSVQTAEKSPSMHMDSGHSNMNKGKFQEATEEFLKVLEAESNNFEANLAIGQAYYQMGKYESALKHFKKAAELESKHFGANSMIGHVYLNSGKFKEAIEQFEKSLTIPSDNRGAVEDTKRGLQHAREMENGQK